MIFCVLFITIMSFEAHIKNMVHMEICSIELGEEKDVIEWDEMQRENKCKEYGDEKGCGASKRCKAGRVNSGTNTYFFGITANIVEIDTSTLKAEEMKIQKMKSLEKQITETFLKSTENVAEEKWLNEKEIDEEEYAMLKQLYSMWRPHDTEVRFEKFQSPENDTKKKNFLKQHSDAESNLFMHGTRNRDLRRDFRTGLKNGSGLNGHGVYLSKSDVSYAKKAGGVYEAFIVEGLNSKDLREQLKPLTDDSITGEKKYDGHYIAQKENVIIRYIVVAKEGEARNKRKRV